jgi:mono/diheme cytochrome c family protein
MIPDRYFHPKQLLLLTILFVFSSLHINAQDGKTLFQNKCASCHAVKTQVLGPALAGFQDRANGKWADIKELTKWIHDPINYIKNDPYLQELKASLNNAQMTGSPELTEEQIQSIADYINSASKTETPTQGPATVEEPSGRGALIFGIISLIMAIIALILMQVNSNLKKLSDDAEGILRPEPVPFYRNKAYIALFSIVLFIVGGFYVVRGGIDLGRQKKYQPEQPIFYSHKVHAGINQISCLYCHGAAMESRHAAVPSVNVCMNCHKTITEYTKGPKLFREDGTEVNGTAEIQKIYKYAGFDPKNANAWDPSKAKPIAWTKIHNLPDHVYFNHSQHVKAGKVQCQSCHGEITAMDEVYQFSELSMGWCINCHRQTKVDFYKIDSSGRATGNKFYSIYEKFHDDLRSGKMDSVTVKDIGGLECQKCHY